jgi:hypothetical protein
VLCETTIAIDGTPYTGACSSCDFVFALDTTITSETGIGCSYDEWSPKYTFLADTTTPYVYLGFDGKTPSGLLDAILVGYARYAGATPSFNRITPDSFYGAYADYTKGLLEWTWDFTRYIPPTAPSTVYPTCGPMPFAPDYTFKNYGGAYYVTDTVTFETAFGYDLWSFVATDAFTYITLDTTDTATAFDAAFVVYDDTGCPIIESDDQFECTYPPPLWKCASYPLATTVGDTYKVLVHSWDVHASGATEGDYKLSLDASSDPGLTLEKDNVPTAGEWTIKVEGMANIP